MNDTLALARLDLATIRSYLTLKAAAIMLAMVLILSFTTDTAGTMPMAMMMALTAVFASYPFVVGEKSNMDVLYATLRLKRRSIVAGRYLFVLAFDLMAWAVALLISLLVNVVAHRATFDPMTSLATGLVLLIIFSLIQAIQLPLFFKLGYTKAKLLAYAPLFAIPVIVFGGMALTRVLLTPEQATALVAWPMAHLPVVIPVALVTWAGLIVLSYRLSTAFYARRDF